MTTCCPCRDAGLASSLNYNMHKIALYPMVRIASPLTLPMLASRHCGPATGGQYKDILVIHSSFLMRLWSHNPLSTPFDPQSPSVPLCQRGILGDFQIRGTPLILRRVYDQTPGIRLRRTALSAPPMSLVEAQHAVPLHPPGQSPLHRRERIRVRVTATVTAPPDSSQEAFWPSSVIPAQVRRVGCDHHLGNTLHPF